jgi:hypothetical protein
MDFTAIEIDLGVGLICSTLGFLYGLGARPGLVSRLDAFIDYTVERKMNDIVETFESKPEILQKLGRPLIRMGMNELSKEFGGGGQEMKDLKIGGIKVPAWAVQLGMSWLDRSKQKVVNQASNALEDLAFPK